MTRRSIHFYSQYEPWESIKYLSPIPLLMIVTKNDTVTSTEDQIDAYDNPVLEPKHFSINRWRSYFCLCLRGRIFLNSS